MIYYLKKDDSKTWALITATGFHTKKIVYGKPSLIFNFKTLEMR